MPALPVTIFTGFLGSGKTTLLASLLAAERDSRFAIVVNEFGEVSVDDVLLQQTHGAHRASVFKLTRGLIAYAGDDFTEVRYGKPGSPAGGAFAAESLPLAAFAQRGHLFLHQAGGQLSTGARGRSEGQDRMLVDDRSGVRGGGGPDHIACPECCRNHSRLPDPGSKAGAPAPAG